jgi:predicted O-methyltransferase YrrM
MLEQEWMPDWAAAPNPLQIEVLNNLCELSKGGTFIDIGCFIGGFTKVMAAQAKKRNGKCYAIDLFQNNVEPTVLWGIHQNYPVKHYLTRNLRDRGLIDFVDIIEGDSVETSKKFQDNTIDFIFIDASHEFTNIKNDLDSWYPKVKQGGIICGHDYEAGDWDEEHIEDDGYNGKHHGVIKAVREKFGHVQHKHTIWHYRKEQL